MSLSSEALVIDIDCFGSLEIQANLLFAITIDDLARSSIFEYFTTISFPSY